MAAQKGVPRPDMKGNQMWKLRAKHGRDKIFNDPNVLWESAAEYFQWCDDNPYTKVEQKKGNTVIPRGTELTTEEFNRATNPLAEIPIMRPYTIQGLTLFLGVHTQYFTDFEKSLENMEDRQKANNFSVIITRIKEIISRQKLDGAMIGAFNPMIVARIEGLKDKQDITSNNKDIVIGKIEFINSK
jgi:hypothetical protein